MLDHVGSHVQTASLGDYFLKVTSLCPVTWVCVYLLNRLRETFHRKVFDFQKFTCPVVRNSRRNTRLIVPDGDCYHGHSLCQRLERCIQPGMRNAERCPLEKLNLRSIADD